VRNPSYLVPFQGLGWLPRAPRYCLLKIARSIYFGALGDDSLPTGSPPSNVPGVSQIVGLASGFYHTCALRSDGVPLCWGYGANGELGVEITGDSRAEAMVVPGVENAVAISVGSAYSCVLKVYSTVQCWGIELLSGSPPVSEPPTVVPGLSGVVQVAVGGGFVCALKDDGDVVCWGANDQGQLGDGTNDDSLTPVTVHF
jgi:alpha-tubulin suppressor-like RCC1 family protein